MEAKSVFICVRMSKELRRLIKAQAKRDKLTMSDVVRKFIEKGIHEDK